MRDWYEHLRTALQHEAVAMVTIVHVDGSAPREVGARMLVTATALTGTIGGGALEHGEIGHARALLAQSADGALERWYRERRVITLGPDVEQCCGGVVVIYHEVFQPTELPALRPRVKDGAPFALSFARLNVSGEAAMVTTIDNVIFEDGEPFDPRPAHDWFSYSNESAGERFLADHFGKGHSALFIYGAGHVGRALVRIVATLPFDVTWVDVAVTRFPERETPDVHRVVTADPAAVAAQAPSHSLHIVVTHSHALDEAICTTLLQRNDVAFLGLIGSATKRARFVQRFRRAGIADDAIARLVCPIGDPRIAGKDPAVIAVAVAAQLLQLTNTPRDEA